MPKPDQRYPYQPMQKRNQYHKSSSLLKSTFYSSSHRSHPGNRNGSRGSLASLSNSSRSLSARSFSLLKAPISSEYRFLLRSHFPNSGASVADDLRILNLSCSTHLSLLIPNDEATGRGLAHIGYEQACRSAQYPLGKLAS